MKRFFVAVLLAAGLIGTANAQPVTADADKYPNLANPVVLAQPGDLPDVAECRGLLTQTVIDIAKNNDDDPGEGYEKFRKQHPHMIMEPPPLECASKLWKALKKGKGFITTGVTVPSGTEALSLRQYPMESLFNFHASAASVGSNVNPANGVEGYQGETSISIDPNNPQHLIAFSNTFFKDPTPACQSPTGGTANTYGTMALFGSSDGGATWTYNCAPWPAGATGGVTGAAFWFGSDPALAWDNQGRAYATYMLISQNSAGTASGASIVTARSSDNGLTWQNLGIVVNNITSSTAGDDKEMMAIDNTSGQPFSHPGRIYVIWDSANNEKIAYSDDGAAWTTVPFASNTGAIGGNVVVGADGTVYVIWNRYNVETIVFSKSTDGGATWTAPAVISTMALQSFGSNNTPPAQNSRGLNAFGSIDIDRNAASPYFGTLYVSFPDFPAGTTTGSDINTYVIRSTDGGTTWSSRVKVNDDSFGATQFFPWLSVDQSDGTVNVSWYDTRLDPLNRKTQMVYARSSNGGVSFEPNILVTDNGANWRNAVNYADENSADNATFNGNQYGDYSGIAALNRQVHPLWTDSRSFFPTADTQSPTRREDNATSTIVNCTAPSTLSAPAVNPTTAPSVVVSWAAPASWGTNATGGTYSVYRNTTNTFPGGSPLASGLTSTNYIDSTGTPATSYFYFVRAKNNCPGTILTPMTKDSAASTSVVFGNAGNPEGVLQGTVTSAGNPVSGATVTAGTFTATTNASGFYQFPAIDPATYTVGASATGYSPASVPGVVVSGNATTTQNLTLTPLTPSACSTDTTYADFTTGTTATNVDVLSSVGDVKLGHTGGEQLDLSVSDASSSGNAMSSTTWWGQTFSPTVSGTLTKLDVELFCSGCSGTSASMVVNIHATSGGLPTGAALATTTIPAFTSGAGISYVATFATPASLTAGTVYAFTVHSSAAISAGTYAVVRTSTNLYAGGVSLLSSTSGASWAAPSGASKDLEFHTYITTPFSYPNPGNLVSATKDSGAAVGASANWQTLSWTATTPANTSVKFQAAGSNSASGPFTFVGPDGTAGTFFTTTGASLAQFNGKRYLQYKAFLATTDNTVTPTLSDVTVCQQVVDCASAVPAVTPTPSAVCASSAGNTASGPAGATTYAWSITNGTITSASNAQSVTYTAGASGSVGLSLTVTTASGCQAVGSASVTINAIPATPTINAGGPTTFCSGGSVTLTSSSATGNQWYLNGNPIGGATNNTYSATASGNYTVVVTTSGCSSPASAATTVTVNPIPATPTINAGGPTTFCAGGSVTLTSSSAAGNQWYLNGNPIGGATNNTYNATASGDYTVVVTTSGCSSAASAATTVTVNPAPATPTINAGGPTTFCTGGSVTLTSSSATGNQWYLNGNPIGGATSNTYNATASGDYTVVVTASGCSSPASATTTVTVNPIPATPTINAGGPTTFCAGGSVTLTSSSASGNQWYLNGNPIGGATNNAYNATASGNYTVIVTTSGCSSAASSATSVTVNPTPATPTINAGGPTTFCAGGSVTLTSSSATGNQWYLNGNPIGGATSNTYNATGSGDYTVVVTASGCSSSASATTTVTVAPPPASPAITISNQQTVTTAGPTGTFTLTFNGQTTSAMAFNATTALVQAQLNGLSSIGGAGGTATVSGSAGNYVVTFGGSLTGPQPQLTAATAGGATATVTAAAVCASSAGNTASGPAGATTYAWSITNGTITSANNIQTITYTAGASGTVTLNLTVTNAASCSASSAPAFVPVTAAPATPTINAGGPTTFCAGGSVTLTSSSATGNQWYLNGSPIGGATSNTYNATASGDYTVVVTNGGCSSAASTATTVTVNPAPATPTINAGGPTTFCAGGSVTLTSSSATGNQWYLNGNPIGGATNNTYSATASGDYTVIVTTSGCSSAASAATTVTVSPAPATPTINAGGPTTFCAGGSVTLTSSSATGNQWYLNGNPIGGATSNTYNATASGDYTVIVTTSGCSSAASAATTVTVNPAPATPTINAGGPTAFCAGGSVTLTSSSATGNQWYLNGNPIGGATNNTYLASAAGDYTVVVTASGCSSAPSAATTVSINPAPNTPTINAGGPTTFCAGGSVTLTSNSPTGNQWYLNGSPIGGATSNTYNATASGDYTVVVTSGGCSSSASAATTVTVNPAPATPTINAGGPTTFCAGGGVTLTSSSATGNQWYLNGNPIGGATSNTYNATASGNYTVVVTTSGCSSAASAATTVTVNPIPATPTINAGGPTTFCAGGSVTLTSSSASGNQWYLNGNPIGGATSNTYNATASGNYTVVVTTSGCSSAASAATTVTANPAPATPTINAGGPTTFCTGGSVTLTSSSASGNQWYLNGNPIGGATSNTYLASVAGDYTVIVTTSGCSSAASAATTVTINPIPNATITGPASVTAASTGNLASVANAGVGATYAWSITGGTITAGTGTPNITFTAGAPGTLTLQVTVSANGCSDTKSLNVPVTSGPTAVTVTAVTPPAGKITGGRSVTITGTGFLAGATVTFGGSAATSVVVVNATTITAVTPAHAAGAVNVTVTNTNTTTGTRTNGYTYVAVQFDPNGDGVVDPADIFYLVNYLFLSGPQPMGPAGLLSGDANGDGLVDPADIFYVVNYLFMSGPAPNATKPAISSQSTREAISGAVTLGEPVRRGNHFVVPVSVGLNDVSAVPQALSLRVTFGGAVRNAVIHRAGSTRDAQPAFEISRAGSDALAYLLVLDGRTGSLGRAGEPSTVVAELEFDARPNADLTLSVDPALTLLSDRSGTMTATVAGRTLSVGGTSLQPRAQQPQSNHHE